MAITTEMIKECRELSGAGIMDCKRALEQAGGNMERALEILRQQGLARAAKKAGRVAMQGLVDAYIHAGGRIGALIEVNCETDFVARTDEFRQLVHDLAMQVAAMNPSRVGYEGEEVPEEDEEGAALLDQAFIKDPSITVRDLVNQAIGRLGENIVVRRFCRFELGT